MKQSMAVLTSQNTQEWYTPSGVIELARATMGSIDLDPASCDYAQRWIKAKEYRKLQLPTNFIQPHWSDETKAYQIKQESMVCAYYMA